MKITQKFKAWLSIVLIAMSSLTGTCFPVFAQTSDTTTEITNIILAWMPLIIIFAMLGMVLGILKKFGKF